MNKMTPDILPTLTPSYDAARKTFSRLTKEAANLHDAIRVNDEASRAVFNALSRIQAFSDQIELIMALMREDVRMVEELSGLSENLWTEQFGDSFQVWLRTQRGVAMKAN